MRLRSCFPCIYLGVNIIKMMKNAFMTFFEVWNNINGKLWYTPYKFVKFIPYVHLCMQNIAKFQVIWICIFEKNRTLVVNHEISSQDNFLYVKFHDTDLIWLDRSFWVLSNVINIINFGVKWRGFGPSKFAWKSILFTKSEISSHDNFFYTVFHTFYLIYWIDLLETFPIV